MILWLVYILVDAAVSWYLIEKRKKNVDHLVATIIRWWAMILIGITVPIVESTLIPWLLFTGTSFWLIFDPILNTLRGRSFFYIGENAKIDRFGKKHPLQYWSLKLIALLILIIVVIML